MQSVNSTMADLAKNMTLLELHAEDTAMRLGRLEARLDGKRTESGDPAMLMTMVVLLHVKN
jgi:hypothetical protein